MNHAQEACGFGRVLDHRVDRRGRHRLPVRRHRALSLGTAEQTDPAGRADNDGISGRRADPEIAFPATVEMNPFTGRTALELAATSVQTLTQTCFGKDGLARRLGQGPTNTPKHLTRPVGAVVEQPTPECGG